MRIAFYLNWNERPDGTVHRGVLKKIRDQVTCWQEQQHSVRLFLLTGERCAAAHLDEATLNCPLTIETYQSRLARFSQSSTLTKGMSAWKPDVIYARQSTITPAILSLAHRLPMVMEINADDLIEFRLTSIRSHIYNSTTRGLLLKELAGMVFVTSELSSKECFSRYHRPSTVIGNSIALDCYPWSPPTSNSSPRLAFLASRGHNFYGVDKIIRLARFFPDWSFDLIGEISTNGQGDRPPNLTLHGFLPQDAYQSIMHNADVALGPLALYRKQMYEACPLKVREYLAYGLPTIIGYHDTDFACGAPFLLELPNTPTSISENVERIRQFVDYWKGRRVSRHEIGHLDVKHKERLRLAFLESCLSGVKPA